MKHEQFTRQIDRLSENYGEHHYRAERVKMFWKRYGDIEYSLFSTGVTSIILNKRVAPLMTDFDEMFFTGQSKSQKVSNMERDTKEAEEMIFRKQHKQESDRGRKLEIEFAKRFPKRDIFSFTKYWFLGVFGSHLEKAMPKYGLTFRTFLKSALFDLDEANWIPIESIKIGKQKKMRYFN